MGLNPPPPKLYKFSLSLDIDILISTQSTLEIRTSFLMKTTVWLLFWYRGGGTCRTPPPHAAGPDVLPVLYLCSGPSHHPPAGGWRRGWRRSVRQWGRGEGHLELYGGGPRALPQAFPGETHTQGQTGKKKKKGPAVTSLPHLNSQPRIWSFFIPQNYAQVIKEIEVQDALRNFIMLVMADLGSVPCKKKFFFEWF